MLPHYLTTNSLWRGTHLKTQAINLIHNKKKFILQNKYIKKLIKNKFNIHGYVYSIGKGSLIQYLGLNVKYDKW